MKDQIDRVLEGTDKPFGVNVRTARLQTDHKIMLRKIAQWRKKDPKLRELIIYGLTSAGGSSVASKLWKKLAHDMFHFHVAPALWLVDKVVAAGCDGIVATGTEGGGHQSYEKISTLVLVAQVAQKYPDEPMIACGGFASPHGVASGLALGADAIAMGTRFIASNQSEFHENYKNVVPTAKAQDTIYVTGVLAPIRLWRNKYSLHHELVASKEEKLKEEIGLTLEDMFKINIAYEIAYDGDIVDGAVPLGQCIGVINSIEKVPDIVDSIITDAEKYLKKAVNSIK